ncbi:hypothetical protein E1B28_003792 [Marasmius oreades]|uniref:HSF-type DNA-binding domain-containing protein n=1 Tax=Marasmius oreades TaxID=181124 RepID=A0A9P7UXE9_9AGAR|nr:uncharacterized protein E1B28_003792 [Marasmius oreades]KAG7096348.1 hypothetical protein E1B28_003792 [Marasmius oreades]
MSGFFDKGKINSGRQMSKHVPQTKAARSDYFPSNKRRFDDQNDNDPQFADRWEGSIESPPVAGTSDGLRYTAQRNLDYEPGTHNRGMVLPMSGFLKQLFNMLEDNSIQHVVSWGPDGDCFVINDTDEFTKSVLPKFFDHSNFAVFVRQLDLYDFHKANNSFDEPAWIFRHPDFHVDSRREAFKKQTKRRATASRLSGKHPASTTQPHWPEVPSAIHPILPILSTANEHHR